MIINEAENLSFSQRFDEEVIIKASRNISFDGCTFDKRVKLHVDADIENISFKGVQFNNRLQISYFQGNGKASNVVVDNARFNGGFFQIFYADYSDAVENGRRTKGLVLRNIEAIGGNHAPFIVPGAESPVIERCKAISAGGADNINLFQISGCRAPVIRHCYAIDNRATGRGDGDGFILDWAAQSDPTEDALIEHCYSISNRSTPNAGGINNYRALRSVIRRNHLIDNNIGLKAARYDDFHAYGNKLVNNTKDTHFWDGVEGKGYAA